MEMMMRSARMVRMQWRKIRMSCSSQFMPWKWMKTYRIHWGSITSYPRGPLWIFVVRHLIKRIGCHIIILPFEVSNQPNSKSRSVTGNTNRMRIWGWWLTDCTLTILRRLGVSVIILEALGRSWHPHGAITWFSDFTVTRNGKIQRYLDATVHYCVFSSVLYYFWLFALFTQVVCHLELPE